MVTVQIDLSRAFNRNRLRRIKHQIGKVMEDQVLRRLHEGGDEEGRFAPLDFPRATGDTGGPLYSTGEHLINRITFGFDQKAAWVGTNFIGARVQNFGTKGKGGLLPTIRPKNAKALFLPISPRGAKSERPEGQRIRMYRGNRKNRSGKYVYQGIIRGIASPQGNPPGGGGADFINVQHVDIRPRNFMHLTANNIKEILAVFKTTR